jgi:hypothetical protein
VLYCVYCRYEGAFEADELDGGTWTELEPRRGMSSGWPDKAAGHGGDTWTELEPRRGGREGEAQPKIGDGVRFPPEHEVAKHEIGSPVAGSAVGSETGAAASAGSTCGEPGAVGAGGTAGSEQGAAATAGPLPAAVMQQAAETALGRQHRQRLQLQYELFRAMFKQTGGFDAATVNPDDAAFRGFLNVHDARDVDWRSLETMDAFTSPRTPLAAKNREPTSERQAAVAQK